jgi:hypothetical protein
MLGPLFLLVYRLICWRAYLMSSERGMALKAAWALRFSSMTDGGLDDDFAEQAFQIVRQRPELLDQFERQLQGSGIFALRRRLLIADLRGAVANNASSLFGA